MIQRFPGFPPETLDFLKNLKSNNTRDWFLSHKNIYEEKVKTPMIHFVLALKDEMKKFAKELLVDPTHNIFRIYRDIRFSQDKSPYKTHIAAAFDPADMRKRPSAGLYFHLEPEQLFLGGGIHMPGSAELFAIRHAIAKNPRALRKIIATAEFKKMFESLKGEQLSRVPRGFPQDHSAADLLRYKQYLVFTNFSPKLAETPEIVPETLRYFKGMMPLVRYLNACLTQMPRKLRG